MDGTIDRISNLPCNVIDDILKYLPLIEAVRTSILSRGWLYKWLSIPYLHFDWEFDPRIHDDHNINCIIYQILLLHKGPIVKFTYEDTNYLNSRPAVDQWLHFLSNHCIEELTLRFFYSRICPTIAHHLFTFDHLIRLSLSNCKLRSPSTFKGFVRLVKLDLFDVLIEPADLARFISKCPMLEQLNLDFRFRDECGEYTLFFYFNTTFLDFEIDAPNLKLFRFWGKLTSISFRNISILEEFYIHLEEWETYQGSQINLIELIGQLSSIKKMRLSYVFLQLLARGAVPHKLPNNLSHLSSLELSCVDFFNVAEVGCVVCLIRSSPNLQTLEIQSKIACDGDAEPAAQFLKTEQECELTLSHLENVKICNFRGLESEMVFVKLLLSASTALTKLELRLSYGIYKPSAEQESRMLKQLARFCRASPKAEIIII